METTNTTQPEVNNKKSIRGWSLISMLAAFVLGWAVAFVALQVWHGKSRAKAENAVKPVVNVVQNVVDSLKKPTPPEAEAAKPAATVAQAEAPVPAPLVAAQAAGEPEKSVTADKPAASATTDTATDEREAIRKLFQRNIETVRVLTSR